MAITRQGRPNLPFLLQLLLGCPALVVRLLIAQYLRISQAALRAGVMAHLDLSFFFVVPPSTLPALVRVPVNYSSIQVKMSRSKCEFYICRLVYFVCFLTQRRQHLLGTASVVMGTTILFAFSLGSTLEHNTLDWPTFDDSPLEKTILLPLLLPFS